MDRVMRDNEALQAMERNRIRHGAPFLLLALDHSNVKVSVIVSVIVSVMVSVIVSVIVSMIVSVIVSVIVSIIVSVIVSVKVSVIVSIIMSVIVSVIVSIIVSVIVSVKVLDIATIPLPIARVTDSLLLGESRNMEGENLRAHDANGLSDPYVKVHLLPDTGKRTKLRTRTCQRTLNPLWDEEFCYSGITKAEIEAKMLRLSVLDEDTIGFEWMGEILYPLSHLLHSGKKEYSQIFLQPKNFELDRSLKLEDDDRGKILIGLYYAPAKNELTVRIIQCVNLIAMDPNGYSDPFVKLHLKPDDGTPKKCKTEFKRRTLNPEFEERVLRRETQPLEALLRQPYQRHERWHALWPELSM
uniref:C2 domain-containing protein n=1 Tax=Macrostomum lignano TaxID=282301 RepID=A0A1I8IJ93_9PLAT